MQNFSERSHSETESTNSSQQPSSTTTSTESDRTQKDNTLGMILVEILQDL
jgi:hypothetical protein